MAERFISELEADLFEKGWRTSDTYCNTFEAIPKAPGVYLFECLDYDNSFKSIGIVYVGQARNLSRRLELSRHEVLQELHNDPKKTWFVRRWFKQFPESELRKIERFYISFYDPPFNIVGKRRGFSPSQRMVMQ